MEEENELQRTFQHDINCLLDDDRNLRRKGLNNLTSGLFKSGQSEQDIYNVFKKSLLRNLLRLVSDKVEKHREISIQIIDKFYTNVSNIDIDLVNSTLKEIANRLKDTPFPEQSEEIRLALVHLLQKMFSRGYHQGFVQNLSEITFTLSKVLTDSYADVKKDASLFIIELSQGFRDSIGNHSLSVLRTLSKNLGHQHSKVRKVTVDAMGELLLTRNAGENLKEILPSIETVINDKLSDVRKSTYTMIAKLLNQFSPALLRDHETKLVQLLLNGLSDDNEEIIKMSQDLLEEVGKNIRELDLNAGQGISEEQ